MAWPINRGYARAAKRGGAIADRVPIAEPSAGSHRRESQNVPRDLDRHLVPTAGQERAGCPAKNTILLAQVPRRISASRDGS